MARLLASTRTLVWLAMHWAAGRFNCKRGSAFNFHQGALGFPGAPFSFLLFPFGRVPHPFRALCEKGGIPRPSHAWDFPSLTTRLFHHIFLVRPSQTPNRNSRNNSPTVQHRKQRPSPETDPSSAAKPSSAAL